jgi:RNA polymerase sigma-70 factor (ECF subfamily)
VKSEFNAGLFRTTSMKHEERQLAEGIRMGDAESFRLLYDRHAAQILGYLLRLTNSRAEAEDLVQDVFVAAYVGRTTFRGQSRPISWLLGIATRRWRDRIRRCTPASTSLETLAEIGAEELERAGQTGLEGDVVNSITLTRALAQLEPTLREALLLVRSQGLTYVEAAAIMDEPVGTVKWRVSEATRRMQQQLNAVEGEYDEMQRLAGADRRLCRR